MPPMIPPMKPQRSHGEIPWGSGLGAPLGVYSLGGSPGGIPGRIPLGRFPGPIPCGNSVVRIISCIKFSDEALWVAVNLWFTETCCESLISCCRYWYRFAHETRRSGCNRICALHLLVFWESKQIPTLWLIVCDAHENSTLRHF